MNLERKNTNPMAVEKENKLLLSMAFPIIVSMLVQAVYNIVDSAFVGFWSEDALSAVSLVFPFQTLFSALNVGIGVGISQRISLYLGLKKADVAKKVAGQGMLLSLVCTGCFIIFGFFFTGAFFDLSKVYGTVADMGKSYLSIVCIFSAGLFCESVFSRMLMSTGHTKQSMICHVTGAVLNIILDPILIFGLGPIPQMGVTGAAIATVFAQHVSAIIAFYFHKKYNNELQFTLFDLKPKKALFSEICAIGSSATVKQGAAAVMTMLVNTLIYDFNPTAPAVYGTFNRLYVLFLTPSWAIQDVLIILVAFNLGIGKRERYIKLFKLAISYGTAITLTGAVLVALFPTFFLSFFGAKEEMLSLGKIAFPILASFLPFQTLASSISAMMQGLGKGKIALFAGVVERFVLPVGFVYLFAYLGGLDLVWWSFTLAEIIGMILSAILLKALCLRKTTVKE